MKPLWRGGADSGQSGFVLLCDNKPRLLKSAGVTLPCPKVSQAPRSCLPSVEPAEQPSGQGAAGSVVITD